MKLILNKLQTTIKRVLFIFAVLFVFASCNKDDIDSSFPFELKVTSIENQNEVRLFTKDGEVKDEAVIANYIKNTRNFNMSLKDIAAQSSVYFISKTEAKVGGLMQNVEQKNNNELIFSGDVTILERPSPHSYTPRTPFYSTIYNLSKNNTPLEYIISGSYGTNYYRGKEIRIAQGDYNSFVLPITSYKLLRGGYSNSIVDGNPISIYYTDVGEEDGKSMNSGSGSSGWFFNDFNEDFLFRLADKDTIAIQVTHVKFSR